MSQIEARVPVVRRFSRLYTNALGLLSSRLLETPYSLTEARVIFELAQAERTELRDLRGTLDLDAGYLSRIVGRFEASGIVVRERSTSDARRQVIRLTDEGFQAFALLDRRSAEQVRDLLSGLSDDQQHRLVGAMKTIEAILAPVSLPRTVVLRLPRSGDFGWVVERHGAIYADEYGFGPTFESLVARIVAEYVEHAEPDRQAAWIAEVHGERVGCVFCMQETERVARLRLLLVEPTARGLGIGARLVDECISFARRAGYEQMTLWTNDVLHAARHIYERAGFQLVKEKAHHSFGQDLVGQDWELNL
jgi:DNA-binding MarR family transcriptional regulator/GNAT superfamily N-acetyltransferase